MKLSVIMPCYNEESTLKTILDNVINESYIEKEIIVIDDFSTDNSRKILESKFPDRLVRLAFKRMIPKGPLGRKQLSNMKVYIGDKHPHEAQNPITYNIQDVVK